MTITGGFGVTVDLQTGVTRAWYMGPDGVKRWADTDEPIKDNANQKASDSPALCTPLRETCAEPCAGGGR